MFRFCFVLLKSSMCVFIFVGCAVLLTVLHPRRCWFWFLRVPEDAAPQIADPPAFRRRSAGVPHARPAGVPHAIRTGVAPVPNRCRTGAPPTPIGTPSFLRQKCAKPISPQGAIKSEPLTRKPRRNELFRSATVKPVVVYFRPLDYTARGGLHIAGGQSGIPCFGVVCLSKLTPQKHKNTPKKRKNTPQKHKNTPQSN